MTWNTGQRLQTVCEAHDLPCYLTDYIYIYIYWICAQMYHQNHDEEWKQRMQNKQCVQFTTHAGSFILFTSSAIHQDLTFLEVYD